MGGNSTGTKTCLINRIIYNIYTEIYLPNNGIDIKIKQIILKNGKEINLKLYDTVGAERFRGITFGMLRRTNIDFVVLGYDITRQKSLYSLFDYIEEIKENNITTKLIYLIGNKIDLEKSRVVSKEEGERFAENFNLRFFEVSCKTGEGIEEFLYDLQKEIEKY